MTDSQRRLLVVVGTRPEAVKMAPVVHALRDRAWAKVRVLATAQHRQLLDQILQFFGIRPHRDLNMMRQNQTLADLTSRMISGLDELLLKERPDLVMAQGDTTTVMVTALCCFYQKIPFAHVEAGLRTGNKLMPFPEEVNRSIVGRLADLHFAPTTGARDNLLREGVDPATVHVTGNTVIDALLWTAARVDAAAFAPQEGRRSILVTAHRRENFGAPFEDVCAALSELAERPDVELLYPVHPNPNVREVAKRLLGGHPRVRLTEPLDYPQFVAAMKACHLILTDSGGVQEEAPSLGKPVLVLRDETERPEGVAVGTAKLVGPHKERIVAAANELLDDPKVYASMATANNPYGDGKSAPAIADLLEQFFGGLGLGV